MKKVMVLPPRQQDLQHYTNNEKLWQKIDAFCLDDPEASFPFSKKLAKENNWDATFTQLAIAEYKKFIYLCCVLPNGASPPKIVDTVWHLHLLYTQNYWDDFCASTLGRKLHHQPSTGGKKDHEKHRMWRDNTFVNYYLHFGQHAPPSIWEEKPPSTFNPFCLLHKIGTNALLILLLGIPVACNGGTSATLFSVLALSLVGVAVGLASAYPLERKKTNNSQNGGSCGGGNCGVGDSGGSGGDGGSGCGGGGCGGCGGGD